MVMGSHHPLLVPDEREVILLWKNFIRDQYSHQAVKVPIPTWVLLPFSASKRVEKFAIDYPAYPIRGPVSGPDRGPVNVHGPKKFKKRRKTGFGGERLLLCLACDITDPMPGLAKGTVEQQWLWPFYSLLVKLSELENCLFVAVGRLVNCYRQ